MPQPKTVTITVTANPNPVGPKAAATPYLIMVDEDPVDLADVDEGNHANNSNARIHWKIATSGWEFTVDGVVIDDTVRFTNKGQPSATHHTWQREKKDRHNHKYSIGVTDGTITLIWDPWIINH